MSNSELRAKTIIVTGGAGFIGSCLVRALNDRGYNNIVIVDNIASTEKWKNLRNKKYLTYLHKDDFLPALFGEEFEDIGAIVHLGACSSTTETDFDYLWDNNVEYTKELWRFCTEYEIPFLYASSAATYGGGEAGFDDRQDINVLQPLNGYGYSKQVFDQWMQRQSTHPPRYAGFKFFNVYGPNEYCKGSMASMVYHGFRQVKESGEIRLFKSERPDYRDGGQLRDFVYVKDVCEVILFFLENVVKNGIYNVGTGRAQSFEELADAVFSALGLEPNIRYIEMPENLKEKYQYYTKAEIAALREAGYDKPFMDLEAGARDYVTQHLSKGYDNY